MRLSQATNAFLKLRQSTDTKKYLRHISYALAHLVNELGNVDTESLEPAQVKEALMNLRGRDGRRLTDATRGSIVRIWKLFFDYCYQKKLTRESFRSYLPSLDTVTSEFRMPTHDEVYKVLSALGPYSQHRESTLRDALAVSLAYESGVRSLAMLNIELIDVREALEKGGDLYHLLSHTKGDSDVMVYFTELTAGFVRRYIAKRPDVSARELFVTQHGRLSSTSFKMGFARVCEYAGVPCYFPHAWRRRFITDHNEHGTDLSTIQKLANHSRSETTMKHYIKVNREHIENRVRDVARKRLLQHGDSLVGGFFDRADNQNR